MDSASPLTVENLLDHGSLARDVSEDPALLDIDSDSDTCEGSTVTMPMTLDNDNNLEHHNKTDIEDFCTINARLRDGHQRVYGRTFGFSVNNQSSPVEDMTDHDRLDRTFHGSRMK